MKFRFTAVCVLLMLFLYMGVSAEPVNIEEQAATALHEAEKLLELGKSYEAIAAIDQLMTRHPGSGSEKWAKLRKQEALYHLARHDEAIALGRSLIEAYQASDPILAAWARCNIGICYMARQEWRAAVTELQAVEQMNGSDLYDQGPAQGARARLGEIYLYLNKGQTGGASAGPILGFSSDNQQASAASLSMASAVMAETGDMKSAFDCYERLVREYPLQKKEIASAASDIVYRWVYSTLARNPEIPDADIEKLKELALTPRQTAPGESYLAARAENALGYFFLYLKKDPEIAAVLYQGLISSYPSTAFTNECCYRLASALRQNGDTVGALALYRKVADEDEFGGYKGPAEYGAVGCYMSLGQETEAQAALGRMLSFGGDGDWHQMARIRLANLYAARKQYRESLDLLSVAREYVQGTSGASGLSSSIQSLSSTGDSEELRRIDKMIEQVNELAAGQAN